MKLNQWIKRWINNKIKFLTKQINDFIKMSEQTEKRQKTEVSTII